MSIRRVITGFSLILTMLFRRRIVIIALIVLPLVFLTIVRLTTSLRIIHFRLASIAEDVFIQEPQRGISLVFFSVTSTGFLVSFLALNLVQTNIDVNRRLVICGYHPIELMLSKFLTLLLMIISIAIYIGLLASSFFSVEHLPMYIFSLTLIGFVYGCYGMAIGSIIKGELEGVFLVVLLANIDVGWLQNPSFYAEAQNKVIIRYLPGYFPSQSGLIAAFSDYSGFKPRLYSVLYGVGFLVLAMLVFYNKMRIKK